jgi:protein-disulfide isomerase
MKKSVYIILSLVALGIVALVLMRPSSSNRTSVAAPASPQTNTTNQTTIAKSDLVIGDATAKATIIEYGDFKCPSCNAFHHEAGQQLRAVYVKTGKLKIVFKPLAVIGPDSDRAARGAYCANAQGKFTDYHDKVFNYMWDSYYENGNYNVESQDLLDSQLLTKLAGQAGVESVSFQKCLGSNDFASNTQANLAESSQVGVRGTPTFIIDGKKVVGPQPYGVFKSLVDIQLQ